MFQKPRTETREHKGLSFTIKYSLKRKKTVQFSFDFQKKEVVLSCPSFISEKDLICFLEKAKDRYQIEEKNFSHKSDLNNKAVELVKKYLPEYYSQIQAKLGTLQIEYSSKIAYRTFGKYYNCSNKIVLGKVLYNVPEYVRDYILFHEVVHIISFKHDKLFKSLEKRFPKYERANGYLEAISSLGRSKKN